MGKKILIVAGEASSDLHAANLVKEIKKLKPEAEFFGLGGNRMQEAKVKLFSNIVDLAVVGFVEVLKNINKFKAIFNEVLRQVDILKPDLAILIDYPGFNLRLAVELKKRNISVVYYISPQVWAWGRNRLKLIRKLIDKMIVIFRFEEEFYKKEGILAEFVGHPFLDINRDDCPLDIPQGKTTIALLPGSRNNEIKRLLPVMLEAAKIIRNKVPNSQFLLLRSSSVKKELYQQILENYQLPILAFENKTHQGLRSSDFALIASGSATLEGAIAQKPFLIIYKISWLTWLCLRPIIKIPYIGLVNIVAGSKIIQEFTQHLAQPQTIASHVIETLDNPEKLSCIKNELARVRSLLGTKGAARHAARIITEFLSKN